MSMYLSVGAVKFGKKVRRVRQEDVAARLGTTQQTVSRLLRGQQVPVTHRLVERIREAFGIDPRDWHIPSRMLAPQPKRRGGGP